MARVESQFWIPITHLKKSLSDAEMVISGMATLDDTIDLDQQLLQHTGVIDCLDYLRRYGKVNWNHGSQPGDLLGDITVAEIRKSGGRKGLYIEARLNPEVRGARDAYALLKGGSHLGFSVQGVTLRLSKATHNGHPVEMIDEAFISQVALTPEPKNYNTFAQVLKSLAAQSIDKAMTAGAGTDSAQFTGGRATVAEGLGGKRKKRVTTDANMRQLARHFQTIYGRNADLEKSLTAFCNNWQLSPEARDGLTEILRRQS